MACSSLNTDILLHLAVEILTEALGSKDVFCAVYLYEDQRFNLKFYKAPFEVPAVAPKELLKFLRHRTVAVVEEIPEFAKEHCQEGMLLIVPLSLKDRIIGFVPICTKEKIYIDNLQEEILSTLGVIFAMGIELIRLHSETNRRLEEIRAMQARLIENERIVTIQRLPAGIAHEIKNPLAAAYGIAQMFKPGEPVEPDLLNRLLKTLYRTKEQVFELLKHSKPTLQKLETVRLSKLLEETISLLTYELRKKSVEVIREFDERVAAYVDSSQMGQVFLNLIMNAIDAVKENGRIRIRVKNGYDGSAQVIIADDGAGIPEENLKRLFVPFFTTKEGGSGLGLSICLQIIKNHNGRIAVKSKPGKGTVFSILLPSA